MVDIASEQIKCPIVVGMETQLPGAKWLDIVAGLAAVAVYPSPAGLGWGKQSEGQITTT